MTTSGATSDSEWYNEWQQMTVSDSEWQKGVQRVKRAQYTLKNGWLQFFLNKNWCTYLTERLADISVVK